MPTPTDDDDDLLRALPALDMDAIEAERLRRKARLAISAQAQPWVWSWPNVLLPAVLSGTIFVYLSWAVSVTSAMH
ncbi:MAG: hypothetical protein ACHREM_33215 [Polyangiales bacterium]